MTALIILLVLCFAGWIYYQLVQRIGEDQKREWEEYVKANPQLFRKPAPIAPRQPDAVAALPEPIRLQGRYTVSGTLTLTPNL